MTWTTLDQLTLLDDWPWSAFHWRTMRDVLDHVRTERFYKGGVCFRFQSEERWCSLWPVPWGIFWLYVGEWCEDVKVRLRANRIDFDGETAGQPAVEVHATTMRPGGLPDLPPANRANWELTLNKSTSSSSNTLTAPIRGRGNGWVGVLIWTWSRRYPTAEDVATIVGGQPLGVLELALNPTDTSGERALLVLDRGSTIAKDTLTESPLAAHQVMHVDASAADVAQYWLAPPWAYFGADAAAVGAAIHALGVLEVEGVAVEAHPASSPSLPGQRAFEPGEPASGRVHFPMVTAANQMARTRVPTWSVHPYQYHSANAQALWLMRGESLDESRVTGSAGTSADYVSIDRCLVNAAIPDSDGYSAVATLYALAWNNTGGPIPRAQPVSIIFRLSAWTVGASPTLIVAGDELDDVIEVAPWTLPTDWRPLEEALKGFRQLDHWQWRGALAGRQDFQDWGSTLRSDYVKTFDRAFMPETSITYPCELRLDVRLVPDESIALINLGSGIASRIKTGVPLG